MRLNSKWLTPGRVCLLVLCFANITVGQDRTDCRQRCDQDYWQDVSQCYRANTRYTEIRKCQDSAMGRKGTCLDRCSEPVSKDPADCGKRCDKDYWDGVSQCYRSSTRYSEIRNCQDALANDKTKCFDDCARSAQRSQ